MNEVLIAASSLAAGLLLGGFFFGGLWWTVNRGISSPRPALWFLGSLLLRLGVVLPAIYLVGRGNWQRWLWCVLGFALARLCVGYLTGPATGKRGGGTPEARHAA